MYRNVAYHNTNLAILRCLFLCVVTIALNCAHAQSQNSPQSVETKNTNPPLQLNLRIVWGGDKPADYAGTIQSSSTGLKCIHQLGIDPYDASFLINDNDSRISVHDRETRFGGADIQVVGQPTDQISVRLKCTDLATGKEHEKTFLWEYSDLRDSNHVEELGVAGCKLSISRVPGDRIRFSTDRTHLIYNAEEPLACRITPSALPWHETQCSLDLSIVRVNDGTEVVRQSRPFVVDKAGNGEASNVMLSAPKEQGVYELRCRIEPKRFLSNILGKKQSEERSVQFLVYDHFAATTKGKEKEAANSVANGKGESIWRNVWDISMAPLEFYSRVNSVTENDGERKRFPILHSARSFALGQRDSKSATNPSVRSASTKISVTDGPVTLKHKDGITATLTNLKIGRMHRIQIIASSGDLRLSLNIKPEDAQQESKHPIRGKDDSHFLLESSQEQLIQQAIAPTEGSSNRFFEVLFWPSSQNARLSIVNEANHGQATIMSCAADEWIEPAVATFLPKEDHDTGENARVLELHTSNLRELFGSRHFCKAPYDDWNLFLHFAESLGAFCSENQFDSVSLLIDQQGCALFPSKVGNANFRSDTGIFHSDGRDPIRKDLLELIFRALARKGIGFIPMLELSSPIRDLEEAKQTGEHDDIFQQAKKEESKASLLTSSYNPVSSQVKRSLAACIQEVENRYRVHSNYSGVALKINEESHLYGGVPLQLSNLTIQKQFAEDSRARDVRSRSVSIGAPKDSETDFQRWIAEKVVHFLQLQSRSVKFVSVTNDWEARMPIEFLNSLSVPIRSPLMVSESDPFASNLSRSILEKWNVQTPEPLRFAVETMLWQSIRGLLELDNLAVGFQGEEAESVQHQNGAGSVSRVRVWQSSKMNRDILISNAGAVDEFVQLEWNVPPKAYRVSTSSQTTERLGAKLDSIVVKSTNDLEWIVLAPAGDAIRLQVSEPNENGATIDTFDSGRSKLISWKSNNLSVRQSLNSALVALEQSINVLNSPFRQYDTIRNSGFELPSSQTGRGRIEGWATSLDPSATVSIDTNLASEGEASLKFECRKESSTAWIQSDVFSLKSADRFLLGLQVSSSRFPSQVTLTLSRYIPETERYVDLATRRLDSSMIGKRGGEWTALQFDLSAEIKAMVTEGESLPVRLQIESKGVGQFWLDDLFVSTEFLSSQERQDIRSELFLAKASLQRGDTGPANAILVSPQVGLLRFKVPDQQEPKTQPDAGGSERNNPTSQARSPQNQKPILGRRIRNLWGQRNSPTSPK